MINSRQSSSEKVLLFTFQNNQQIRTKPCHNLYTTPKNHEFAQKKFQIGRYQAEERNRSKPRDEYIFFQRHKSKGIKDRYAQKFVEQKLKEEFQQKISRSRPMKTNQYFSSERKRSKQRQTNSRQRNIYTIKSNVALKQKQINNYKLVIKNKQPQTEETSDKLQITFNMQSTQPDQPQQQPKNQYYNFQIANKFTINRNALQIWKKRKIERQIKQKEVQYRSLIRSLSRKSQKQKSVIKNKMKQVLDNLFLLTKEIKK